MLEGEARSHFLIHIQSTGLHILEVWSGDTQGSQDHFRDPEFKTIFYNSTNMLYLLCSLSFSSLISAW